MFSTDFIFRQQDFRQQENLVDNQKCHGWLDSFNYATKYYCATVLLSRMQFDMRIWPYLKSDSLALPVNGDAKIQGQ